MPEVDEVDDVEQNDDDDDSIFNVLDEDDQNKEKKTGGLTFFRIACLHKLLTCTHFRLGNIRG
jgi:hypothetical protein